MNSECLNDCKDQPVFPKRPFNRPGLSRIDYRIGSYSDIMEAILWDLDRNEVLSNWTHRGKEDPGIALLEGAAILFDILTFYQEIYANEVYLRTAQWKESISDIVKLLGYRLSPGQGGRATFVFEVKGDKPVIVPMGFQIKAQVTGSEQSVEFESVKEVKAYPHLNRFNLYYPRIDKGTYKYISIVKSRNLLETKGVKGKDAESITAMSTESSTESSTTGSSASVTANTQNELEVIEVNGKNDASSINSLDLKPGDRIMLVPNKSQKIAGILIIKDVQKALDHTTIIFEGSIPDDYSEGVKAYRIGRSFRHFGHNAPELITIYGKNGAIFFETPPKEVKQIPNDFFRYNSLTTVGIYSLFNTNKSLTYMPLDAEIGTLAEGNKLICQGYYYNTIGEEEPFLQIKIVNSLQSELLVWGHLTGSATVATIDTDLIDDAKFSKIDIRKIWFYEVKGQEMTLAAPTILDNNFLSDPKLNYFGTNNEVQALAGRSLFIEGPDGKIQATVTIVPPKNNTGGLMMQSITLDYNQKLSPLDFNEEKPIFTVYGNLIEATQGKTEKEAVLGNGDSAEIFQTFKLPKSPLTYLNSAGETPPEVPELQVYVNNRLWKLVNTFFGKHPRDEIYIVRQDIKGESLIQFGDGKTGARLPSGINNVVARYRTGTGAFGALKDETSVQAVGKMDRLDKILMPGIASGGSQPESANKAKEAAPGKIQSLGRLVSLRDYETETLALAGVMKVSASWDIDNDNMPGLILTVLMENGREKEINTVSDTINKYNICRGPQRYTIRVLQGNFLFVCIDVNFALDPTYRKEIVEKAIKEALGVTGEEGNGIDGSRGLFGPKMRQFGQNEYATRIEGVIQNVEGVVWAKVKAFGISSNLLELNANMNPEKDPVINCGKQQILILNSIGLQLMETKADVKEVC